MHLVEATSEDAILQQMVRAGGGGRHSGHQLPPVLEEGRQDLKYASDRGMVTIAITDSHLSPLAEHAQHLLLARSDMVSFVDSLVGPLSVLNALIVAVAHSQKDGGGPDAAADRGDLGPVRSLRKGR